MRQINIRGMRIVKRSNMPDQNRVARTIIIVALFISIIYVALLVIGCMEAWV